jgi:hypothetical protein
MKTSLHTALCRILKPLVRILHRKGVSVGELSQVAKQIYVEVSEEVLEAAGERATTSRIAIATGLTRKDVAQLRLSKTEEYTPTGRYNRSVRVLGGWMHDREFLDADGQPARLPLRGEQGSFEKLVSRYSGDMPYRAMLHEMERVDAVLHNEDGTVQLLTAAYIPHENEAEKLAILGTDVSLLISTIDHNLSAPRPELRFQRKVSYDNLPLEVLPEFKSMVNKDGLDLLIKFNEWLSQRDRDSNTAIDGSGRMRAGVGIYYFEEPVPAVLNKPNTEELPDEA